MGGARSAGGLRFKVGRKEPTKSDLPTARETREISRAIARQSGAETFRHGGNFRSGMKWFSEYERILDLPEAWTPEKAQWALEMTATLLPEGASREEMQRRVSTIFYCLAIIARKHGISPRGIVSVEPLRFTHPPAKRRVRP